MKPFIKRDARTDAHTDGHRAFYNLPSRTYRPAGDKNDIFEYCTALMVSEDVFCLQVTKMIPSEQYPRKQSTDLKNIYIC